ncbi:BQ5605_C011g06537 [Microbotryum silenes-dioicae]|uniref:BQ5605_C011g06537 protein n=1 Tax=Microbotryum silenes-dioicae TaxID=796604 RepID=A0A2X0MIJ0_9BASI|nr:BQ5605_C011g06537 [Microbotryum silenes-dioicae]
MSSPPSRASATASVRLVTMRDRDTPADRRERAQAHQKRTAANTKAADNKRRRLDVAVGVSQA